MGSRLRFNYCSNRKDALWEPFILPELPTHQNTNAHSTIQGCEHCCLFSNLIAYACLLRIWATIAAPPLSKTALPAIAPASFHCSRAKVASCSIKVLPSKLQMLPLNAILLLPIVANALMGVEHPPIKVLRKSRSTFTAIAVASSFN